MAKVTDAGERENGNMESMNGQGGDAAGDMGGEEGEDDYGFEYESE